MPATIPGIPLARSSTLLAMKLMTRTQAETKRRQAVRLLQCMGKYDDAARFEAMTPEEYAEHKHAQIQNPTRRPTTMARATNPTAGELSETLSEIADLAEEALDPELTREELVGKIKELADLASGETEEEEEEEEADEDDDDSD